LIQLSASKIIVTIKRYKVPSKYPILLKIVLTDSRYQTNLKLKKKLKKLKQKNNNKKIAKKQTKKQNMKKEECK